MDEQLNRPAAHKMSVSVGGRMEFDKSKRRWMFNGRWWKPWTWFRWRRYYEVTNFQMVEVSLVKQPPDPVCGIRYDEADCTPEELEELMRKCRDSRLGEEHHSEFLGVSPVNRCSASGMQELEYKCQMNGVNLVLADRWFPSTKLCGQCGCLNEMPLSERTYRCGCGHTEDRDVNAAQNLCTLGFRGIYACGQKGSGHRLVVGDETSLDEAGTQSLATSTSCHI